VLERLWAPIVAVTAAHDGRENGLISSTVVTASLLPESPRIVVQLSKTNLTRDLVCASGAFAVHSSRRALRRLNDSTARFRAGGAERGHVGARRLGRRRRG
jgi:flavin reductase (DIM6/NTAB) family NADH-FMN oxidoreductase RutF